ncbi:carboxypeptidase-like regulatory domain-containing protein [Flavivirga spongiicola]|uniref:Carboxypeptidase-like regulatory domain-containing protein n=1 Tax=Flavivirga spongiicola TaxID=421621 RepID=A0ABU7XZB4_9FLAO|nr:carboxypeptidase-like regulatory domain-containing protein [Flavivirga sp. MEBiC05379]MDO5981132.1 carboxypeptidase-like regulatory domain-containing protein [Flavivirga sp. MEBiC05379]
MKSPTSLTLRVLTLFLIFSFSSLTAQDKQFVKEIKGEVIDQKTKDALVFSDIVIASSNISTVTNTDGKFLLKIPQNLLNGTLIISHLGYEKKEIKISTLENKLKIALTPAVTELTAVEIDTYKDAKSLLEATLKNRSLLYNNSNTLMTAFYRETIKKRRKNASLSEAVVQIHKRPYDSHKKDAIELIKSRKKTDYTRLDTLAVKLQGGPFSNLYTDIIKYPEYIFTSEDISLYDFSFDASTRINENLVYVVNFKQKPNVTTPLYYGKLYIDAKTLALTNAVYSLNVENKKLTSQMYVRKKPGSAIVYPTQATYRVNYRTKNGKWHYAYSNISLTFKVNWKRKLFNNVYTLNSEMAVTDWRIKDAVIEKPRNKMMRPTTILADATSGFSDPKFWGLYNIIEPEKSIESAIKKIQRQLKKAKANQAKAEKA